MPVQVQAQEQDQVQEQGRRGLSSEVSRSIVTQTAESLGSSDAGRLIREPGYVPTLDIDPVVNRQLVQRVREQVRTEAAFQQARQRDAERERLRRLQAAARPDPEPSGPSPAYDTRRLGGDRVDVEASVACIRTCAPYFNCRGGCGKDDACLARCESLNNATCRECLPRNAARSIGW